MNKGKYEGAQPQKASAGVWIIVALLVVLIVVIAFRSCGTEPLSGGDGTASQTDSTVEKNPDSIAIPGYEMLELKAGSVEQTLCLPNPPQNVCLFQISLYLEDGTLLWQSKMIEPGETSAPISLAMALEKGTYPNAVLKYNCFKLDGTTPLNGAETKLTLWVK